MNVNKKILDDLVRSFKHAGMVMTQGEAVIYSKCSGLVNVNSMFNIGSISKVFTAVGILILKDIGKVNLDGKVVDYLPNFVMKDSRYKDITLRMLLNHSSGLRGNSFTGTGCAGYKFCDVKKQFMENIHNSSLQYEPGFTRVYCDDGFFLAQVLIEEISGLNFCNFIEKYMSKKIGLKHIGPSVGEIYKKFNVIPCYRKNIKLPYEYINAYGAAGLSANLIDLCKFSFYLYSKENIISVESQKELFSTQYYILSKLLKENSCFGMPWDLIINNAFIKQGNTSQYGSLLYLFPEDNISISFVVSDSDYLKFDKEAIFAAFPEYNVKKTFFMCNSIKNFNIYDFLGYYISKYDVLEIKYNKQLKILTTISCVSEYVKYFLYVKENCFLELGMDNQNIYTFKKIYGKRYFCEFDTKHNWNIIRLEEFNIPSCSLDFKFIQENLNNKLWFRINESLYELAPSKNTTHMVKNHIIKSKVYEKFKLIDFENIKKFVSCNEAVPLCLGTGQAELKFDMCDGNFKLALLNGRIYIARKNILKLNPRLRICSIKITKQSEWLEILSGCKIKILSDKSDTRALIFADNFSVIYDSLTYERDEYILCKSNYFIELIKATYVTIYYYRNKKILIRIRQ